KRNSSRNSSTTLKRTCMVSLLCVLLPYDGIGGGRLRPALMRATPGQQLALPVPVVSGPGAAVGHRGAPLPGQGASSGPPRTTPWCAGGPGNTPRCTSSGCPPGVLQAPHDGERPFFVDGDGQQLTALIDRPEAGITVARHGDNHCEAPYIWGTGGFCRRAF